MTTTIESRIYPEAIGHRSIDNVLLNLPEYLFGATVLSFLSTVDCIHFSEVSRDMASYMQNRVILRHPTKVSGSLIHLTSILQTWKHLTRLSYTPATTVWSAPPSASESIYSLNGQPTSLETISTLLVDELFLRTGLRVNTTNVAREGPPELETEAEMNVATAPATILHVRSNLNYVPHALTRVIQTGHLYALDLSGVSSLVLCPGMHRIQEITLSGCLQLHHLHYVLAEAMADQAHDRILDLSYCHDLTNQDLETFQRVGPHTRFHLDLSCCRALTDVTSLRHCYSLTLNMCHGLVTVDALATVSVLSLRHCPNLTNASLQALAQVTTLIVAGSKQITSVSSLALTSSCLLLPPRREVNLSTCPVTDVSSLGHIPILILRKCHALTALGSLSQVLECDLSGSSAVTNDTVGQLGHIPTLILSGCRELSVVTALHRCRNLDLSNCPSLVDVSALGNVLELNLSCCKSLSNVSALGSVPTLRLSKCPRLTDVSALGQPGMVALDLSHNNGIISIASLGTIHHLLLYRCENVASLTALTLVKKVNVSSCNLTTLNGLTTVREVDARYNDRLVDVSGLNPLATRVHLAGCYALTHVASLAHAAFVDLSYCHNLLDVSSLCQVATLRLRHCHHLTDVSALGSVRDLDISGCAGITDVSALGTVHYLVASECDGITDVQALVTVARMLDLRSCVNLINVAVLKGTVPVLKLDDLYDNDDVTIMM